MLVHEVIRTLSDKEFQGSTLLMASRFVRAMRAGATFYMAGNGGSAADAAHFTAELVVRYARNRAPVPAVNLAADLSVMTATGNDFGYNEVFARQVAALCEDKDLLVLFSTSGQSANIQRAAEAARMKGTQVAAFLSDRVKLTPGLQQWWEQYADMILYAPSVITAAIQTAHQVAYHQICEEIENELLRPAR